MSAGFVDGAVSGCELMKMSCDGDKGAVHTEVDFFFAQSDVGKKKRPVCTDTLKSTKKTNVVVPISGHTFTLKGRRRRREAHR